MSRLQLEHALPGRLRLRAPRPRRPGDLRAAAERLRSAPAVTDVQVNEASGGLLVHFNPETAVAELVEGLVTAGVEVAADEVLGEGDSAGPTTGALLVQKGLGRANLRLHHATGGKVDLRLAVPAVFALLAARQFMRDAGRIRNASWYQLLYWAFDSFDKLHARDSG